MLEKRKRFWQAVEQIYILSEGGWDDNTTIEQ